MTEQPDTAEFRARAEVAEAQVREDVLALDEAYAMLRTALARAEVAEARIRELEGELDDRKIEGLDQ